MSEKALLRILVGLLATMVVCVCALVAYFVALRPRDRIDRANAAEFRDAAAPEPGGPPAVYDSVPPFTLTQRTGETVSLEALRGKAWIAGFIYSTCPGPCPMVTSRMAELQRGLRGHPRWDDLRLVSFSVDPEKDTPERLRGYAEIAGADAEHWLFLTGSRRAMWDLIVHGFKLPVEANQGPAAATQPVLHTQKMVLVDPHGRIRGYYEALEEDGRAKLRSDLEEVLGEFPGVTSAAAAAGKGSEGSRGMSMR